MSLIERLKMQQKPMSLENLPQYVKNLQENGDTGESCVVDIGQIVIEKKSHKWLVMLICVIMSVLTVATYSFMSKQQLIFVVDMDKETNPFQSIPKIISDIGGEVVDVKQNNDSTYEIKIYTRKSKSSFLERLRKNKNINKAD